MSNRSTPICIVRFSNRKKRMTTVDFYPPRDMPDSNPSFDEEDEMHIESIIDQMEQEPPEDSLDEKIMRLAGCLK